MSFAVFNPSYVLFQPLPAKFVVKGMLDRFSSQFTDTRCRALNKFLGRISQHPVVSFNEHLKVFLTAKAYVKICLVEQQSSTCVYRLLTELYLVQEFASYRKQSDGFMSRMSGSVKSIAQSTRVKERDPEFTEMLDNMTVFTDKIAVLDRIAERLLSEKKGAACIFPLACVFDQQLSETKKWINSFCFLKLLYNVRLYKSSQVFVRLWFLTRGARSVPRVRGC